MPSYVLYDHETLSPSPQRGEERGGWLTVL